MSTEQPECVTLDQAWRKAMALIRVHEFYDDCRAFYPMLLNTARIVQVRGLDDPGCGVDESAASYLGKWECNSVVHLAGFRRIVIRESINRIEDLVKNANRADHRDGGSQRCAAQRRKREGDDKAVTCTRFFRDEGVEVWREMAGTGKRKASQHCRINGRASHSAGPSKSCSSTIRQVAAISSPRAEA